MGREDCHTCLLLEDYYRLKVKDYLLAVKTAPWSPLTGAVLVSNDLSRCKDVTFKAGQALLAHWKACEQCRRTHAA